MDSSWAVRKKLDHSIPGWAEAPEYFITLCCKRRRRNQLCYPQTASGIFQSALRLAQLGVWRCELLLLMPDHLHLLASFAGNQEMHQVVARWKRWMAWRENLIFQAGFFDHRLRSVASSCEKWTYIYSNPVRGGLITDPKNWPYVWTAAAFEISERSACKADPT